MKDRIPVAVADGAPPSASAPSPAPGPIPGVLVSSVPSIPDGGHETASAAPGHETAKPMSLIRAGGEVKRDWPDNDPAAFRYRNLDLDLDSLTLEGARQGRKVRFDLFEDVKLVATIHRARVDRNGILTISARIDGTENGYATIVSDGERVYASVNPLQDLRQYVIKYSPGEQSHVALDVDPLRSLQHECEGSPEVAHDPLAEEQLRQRQEEVAASLGSPLDNGGGGFENFGFGPTSTGTGTRVDVMIVYTPGARIWAANNAGSIHHLIAQGIEMGQITLDNSLVPIELRMVHSVELNYSGTGTTSEQLGHLTFPIGHPQDLDGHLDEVFALRNQYGADLVALVSTPSGGGGRAWLLTNTQGNPTRGFSVNAANAILNSNVLIHELGHNMGCHHSRWQAENKAGPSGGLHEYSTGWRWTGNNGLEACSVMTYTDGATLVPVFSNPDVSFGGAAAGSYDQDHSVSGEYAPADNARSLREIASVISNYRAERIYLPDPVKLLHPRGGNYLGMDTVERITWESEDVLTVRLEYSTDNGDHWNTITSSTPAGLGYYDWLVPATPSNSCLVKVSVSYAPQYFDQSAYGFTITQPAAGAWDGDFIQGQPFLTHMNFASADVGYASYRTWNSQTSQNVSTLLRSMDGGTTWQNVHSVPGYSYGSVFFLDENHGWIASPSATSAGFNSKVRRTSDGGVTWTDGSTVPGGFMKDIFFISTSVGFAVAWHSAVYGSGTTGKIWKTTNGGDSWQPVVNADSSLTSLRFIDAQRGWAAGGNGEMWKTTNGGDSWQRIDSDIGFSIHSIFFIDENHGWVAGRNGSIGRSVDGGETWSVVGTGLIPSTSSIFTEDFHSIRFASPLVGWVVGDRGFILGTMDGGLTWTPQADEPGITLRGLHVFDSHTAIAIGSEGTVMRFTAFPQVLTLERPVGGEIYRGGGVHSIRWEREHVVGDLLIELSSDGGLTWQTLAAGVPASAKTHTWTVPQISSSECLVRISSIENPTTQDISPAHFTILPAVDLTTPNGGESWRAGSTQQIRWTTNLVTTLRLEYSLNDGASWSLIEAGVSSGFKVRNWTLPNAVASDALVRITDESNSQNSDVSEAHFGIFVPGITLNSPVGGESWPINGSRQITWQASQADIVSLSYSTNGGATWTVIAGNIPAASGTYTWNLPNTPSTEARVRIATTGAEDSSPGTFRLEPPGEHTELLRTLHLQGVGNRMTLSDNHAFIGGWSSGLKIVDISEPASPALVGSLPGGGGHSYGSALYQNNRLLLANGSRGLSVIDVTDRTSPFLLAELDTPDISLDVAVRGSHAYVADDSSGLRVVDISQPAAPVEVGVFPGTADARRVITHGRYAYLAEFFVFWESGNTGTGGLRVLDLENPAAPASVSFTPSTGGIFDMCVHGSRLYALEWSGEFGMFVWVMDISNPSEPVLLTKYQHPAGVLAISADERFLYLLETQGRVSIVDLHAADDPEELAYSYVAPPSLLGGISVRDNHLFVTALHQGLHVIRNDAWAISPPALPWITSPPVAQAVTGEDFRYQINTELPPGSAIPVSFHADNLPLGLSLDTSTGVITGTIGRADSYDVILTATTAEGSRSTTLRLVAHAPTRVVAWDASHHPDGRASPPPGLSGIIQVSAGASHSLALGSDGQVFAWGSSDHGEGELPPLLSHVSSVAAGAGFNVVLLQDGTVAAWGRNEHGQTSPPAGLSGVIAVAAGRDHALALTWKGEVVAWGRNHLGQTQVPSAVTGAVAIAAGHNHSLALLENGAVIAWGDNASGQCDVPASLANATGIAAGGNHSLALFGSGVVTGWGQNHRGQLTPPDGGPYNAVGAGADHSLGLTADGQIVGWGANEYGQINVPQEGGVAVALSVGDHHGLGLLAFPSTVVPGDNWTVRNPVPAPDLLHDMVAFEGSILIVGESGTILKSDGAGDVRVLPSPVTSDLLAICAGDDKAVAVGRKGTILHSPDGETWTAVKPFSQADFTGVAHGNGTFVATTSSGSLWHSSNGIAWLSAAGGGRLGLFDVAYVGGKFLAVGSGGTIRSSIDGSSWTPVSSPVNVQLEAVAGSTHSVVIAGANGTILNSVNGGPFTMVASGSTSFLRGVATGSNSFFVVGDGGTLLNSRDGEQWTMMNSGTTRNLRAVHLAGGLLAIAGDNGHFAHSMDGIAWNMPGSMVRSPLLTLVAAEGRMLAGGQGSVMLSSVDGSSWSVVNGPFAGACHRLAYFSGKYLAGGAGGALATSDDAIKWKQVTGLTQTIRGFAYGGGRYVAVGDLGSIHGSTNSSTWSPQNSGSTRDLRDVIHAKNRFVAVGDQGTILTSLNAINWLTENSGVSVDLHGIAFGNNTFIAIGAGGEILSSPDGKAWVSRNSPVSTTLHGIGYHEGHFLAVGASGVVITSPDGAQWSLRSTGYTENLHAVGHINNTHIVAGDLGLVLQSNFTTADPPLIVTQPESTQIPFGGSTILSVIAEGTIPLSYQWFRGASGDTSQPVGGNAPTLETEALHEDVHYWVRVSDPVGVTASQHAAISITPQTLAQWAEAMGLPEADRDPLDEPFGDGIKNLVRFALALGKPEDGAASGLPQPALVLLDDEDGNSQRHLSIEFTRNRYAGGISIFIDHSADVRNWIPASGMLEVVEILDSNREKVRFTDSVPMDPTTSRFLRVRVANGE